MENKEYKSFGLFLLEERIKAGLTLREYCKKHNLLSSETKEE